jgi:hypothetical protein
MKTDAIKRNKFSGEYYNFVTEKVGDEDVVIHSFAKNIVFTMGANSGERIRFYIKNPLRVGSRILNIRDGQNLAILPNHYYQTTSITPINNVFGHITSYECIAVPVPFQDLGVE